MKSLSSLYDRTKLVRGDITIFKRYDTPNAEYYFRIQSQGKRHMRKLCRTAEESFKKARQIIDALASGRFEVLDEIAARREVTATVADLCEVYKTSSVDASPDTRTQNIQGLHLILRAVYSVSDAGTLPITQVNAACARRWFEIAYKKCQTITDQAEQGSIRRSANSRYAQARSVLIERARDSYRDHGCWAECLAEFFNAFNTHKFTRLPKPDYNPPSDEIISATLDAWRQLSDRDLFLAIGHELSFGLRKGELAQTTWGHWKMREGYPVLDGPMNVKSGMAYISVRALDPFFSQMKARIDAEHWRGKDTDFVISGPISNRTDSIYRAVGHFLHTHGWDTQKTNHALRAYSGSQIAMRYGIYEAQTFLRHSTVKVTEDHYSHFIRRFRPEDPTTLPVKWATAAAPFIPQILASTIAVAQ